MEVVTRNGIRYVMLPHAAIHQLSSGQFFQPVYRNEIYKVFGWDFGKELVLAVNIEESSDIASFNFNESVHPLKVLRF